MEQKTKFILIGLIGLALAGFALFFTASSAKQLAERERDELKKENATLNSKVNQIEGNLLQSQRKAESLSRDIERVNQDKQEIERKLMLANQAKEELIARLKARQAETPMATSASALQQAPQANDAYWAQILKAKTELEIQLNNSRSDLSKTQLSSEQLKRDQSVMEMDLKALTREKNDLKQQLEYNQKVTDSITQELVRERNDKAQIRESLKTLKNENELLSRQLKSLNTRRSGLEKKLQEISDEKTAIERKFSELESMLTSKVSQVGELKEQLESIGTGGAQEAPMQEAKESVELAPIVVRPDSGPALSTRSAGAEGKVLAINKDNNFVIVDLGEDVGIRTGDTFNVIRDGKQIAAIEVIQVRKNISACDIKKQTTALKIGDAVR